MRIIHPEALTSTLIDKETLKSWSDEICIVDPQAPLPASVRPENCIGVANGLSPQKLLELSLKTGIQHIIQESNLDFQNELNTAACIIGDLDRFLMDPLRVVLGSSDSDSGEQRKPVFRFRFSKSSEKESVLSSLSDFLKEIPGINPILSSLEGLADELLLNAMNRAPFNRKVLSRILGSADAPKEKNENPTHTILHGEVIELICSFNEERIALAVIDPFGTYEPFVTLTRLWEIISDGPSDEIDVQRGGAGLGTRLLFDTGTSIYTAVSRDTRTVVCCALPLGRGRRSLASIPKNVHFTLTDPEERGMRMPTLKITEFEDNGVRVLQFDGPINEDSTLPELKLTGGKLILDLDGVTSINSCGIREWIKWVKLIPTQVSVFYQNCPRWFVEQMNIVAGFILENTTIDSFKVPYYCEDCELITDLLLQNGKDFENGKLNPPEAIECSSCKASAEIDVIEASYFKFLGSLSKAA